MSHDAKGLAGGDSGRFRAFLRTLFAAKLLALAGCDRGGASARAWETNHVSVGPGQMLDVLVQYSSNDRKGGGWAEMHVKARKFQFTESYRIKVQTEGKTVSWEGNAAPRVLRRHNGILYLVAYDRVSQGLENDLFRLFKEMDGGFVEIERTQFPKEIAIQNMGLSPLPYGCGDTTNRLEKDVTLAMNPDDPCFPGSETAHLWVYLETGKQFHESQRAGVKPAFLKDYIQKYAPKPIP